MISFTFKSAFRWLLKNSLFTTIHILGLAISLCVGLFIFFWINKEVSFDQFHVNKEQIYFVSINYKLQENKYQISAHTPANLMPYLAERFPQIQQYARIRPGWENTFLKYQEQEQNFNGFHAEEGFLKMFSFPIIQGTVEEALSSPDKIVLTEKASRSLFGNVDALGRSVEVRDAYSQRAFTVSAILENVPENSSMHFDFLLPYQEFADRNAWVKEWGNSSLNSFLMIKPGTDIDNFEKIASKEIEGVGNFKVQLTPLSEVYLGWPLEIPIDGIAQGSLVYLKIFGGVGILILLIAAVNYLNLTTAQNLGRTREAGIKKVLGSGRIYLFLQGITEFTIIFVLAALLAIFSLVILLPFLQRYWQVSISYELVNPFLLSVFLLTVLVIYGIAGFYPAFKYFEAFQLAALKGKVRKFTDVGPLRKGLITFQFVLASLFIITSISIYRQLKFIREVNIGLNRENVLYFEKTESLHQHFDHFKAELLKKPGIQYVTQLSDLPFEVGMVSSDPWWPGKAEDDKSWFKLMAVEHDFPETFEIKLKSGRWFSRDFNDSTNYVINEATARKMGIENPVGTKFRCWGGEGKIVGVVQDFHQNSLHSTIEPLVFMFNPENAEQVCVRTEPGKTGIAIKNLQAVYQDVEKSYPLDYHFLDEQYERLYEREKQLGIFANTFTGMAIFISGIGIFGLSVLSAFNRRKEVGIRKVNGASTLKVMLLLNQDFLKWVLLAFIIACPFAWYTMDRWLQNFAYRTELSWWIFVLAGLLTMAVALLTISWQSWRAASRNPVDSLRYE